MSVDLLASGSPLSREAASQATRAVLAEQRGDLVGMAVVRTTIAMVKIDRDVI